MSAVPVSGCYNTKQVIHYHLKVASEFVNPKNITIGSKTPSDIENAVFYSSSSFILILLYLYLKSIVINTFFFPILSIKSEISANG